MSAPIGNTNHQVHGMCESPEYKAFLDAKQRCQNPNNKKWKDYGGRGIRVRFKSFEAFYEELGPRSEGMTLDRINTDGDYEFGNVRWSDQKTQQNNKRSNRLYKLVGILEQQFIDILQAA